MFIRHVAIAALLVACQARGDRWSSVDIQHSESESSDSAAAEGIPLAILAGEVVIVPKTEVNGSAEFFAGLYSPATDSIEEFHCAMNFEISSKEWRADCEGCEEAYTFQADNFVVHVDDGTCGLYGFTEEALQDFRFAMGFGDDLLYVFEDEEGWNPVGETYYSEGFTHFEWVID